MPCHHGLLSPCLTVGLPAGLVFFNLDSGPAAAFQRMGVLYFTMLLFELLPFCYMSFYVWDRTFFLSDRAGGLYATSAYYAAHMTASETPLAARALFPTSMWCRLG